MSVQRATSGQKASLANAESVSEVRRRSKGAAPADPPSRPETALPANVNASIAKLTRRSPEIGRAMARLAAEGKVAGVRSNKISARVDPRIFKAAAARLGLAESEVSDVVNASLALVAARDRFKEWWKDPGDTLPDDFELAI